jgi:hypothetical protein
MVVGGGNFLSSWIWVHRITFWRRRVLIVLRLSIPALYHPSMVWKRLKALLHPTAGVKVASDEENQEGSEYYEDHGVPNSKTGLCRCQRCEMQWRVLWHISYIGPPPVVVVTVVVVIVTVVVISFAKHLGDSRSHEYHRSSVPGEPSQRQEDSDELYRS